MTSGLITYEYYNESALIFFFIFRSLVYNTSCTFQRKLRPLVVFLIYVLPGEIIVTTINDSENLWHFYMSTAIVASVGNDVSPLIQQCAKSR